MLRRFIGKFFTPARMIATSFALLIGFGSLLLALPISAVNGESLRYIDALFISASASCVTGLSPVDVSSRLNSFGQTVLLLLMQIGGLGLMTFTTTIYFWLGQRLPIIDRLALQETFSAAPLQIKRVILYILGFTFVTEFLGAISLFAYWSFQGKFDFWQRIWFSIFHAVSAFTNSGFALFPDNFMRFEKDFGFQILITTIIFLGGLGFLVAYELQEWARYKLTKEKGKKRFYLSVQTRLTLVTTFGLVILGTLFFYVTERNAAFAKLGEAEAWLNAYSMTIFPRTAGFNAVSIPDFSAVGLMGIMFYMFVGAGSGSVAGGVKVGTFGLLFAYTFARFRGETRLNLWNRTIPRQSVDKATAVVVASASVILLAAMLLMITETRVMPVSEGQSRLLSVLFETVSAYCTVGLSMNFTDKLSDAGKFILTLVMFSGRIGAISVALAISLRDKPTDFSYAEENIMIG